MMGRRRSGRACEAAQWSRRFAAPALRTFRGATFRRRLLRAPQPYASEWASVKEKLDKIER